MPKRNITLPPVHNTRAPEQWRIISEHVDFDGKTVLDLGCGHGDLLWRAWEAGAHSCRGVDFSQDTIETLVKIKNGLYKTEKTMPYILLAEKSISEWMRIIGMATWDIIVCFSVLPYLADPTATLHWIHEHSTQALIECQLAGDGPGPDWLKCPQDMRRWLDSIGWKSVERIGETVVKERDTKRGIWLCSH